MFIDWLPETLTWPRAFSRTSARRRHARRRLPASQALVERLEDRTLLAPYTLTSGLGGFGAGGDVTVGVDGYGGFGSNAGADATDATFTPVGGFSPTPLATVFDSYVAIRVGQTGNRTYLSSKTAGLTTNPTVTGTNTQGDSTFLFGGMNFGLSQSIAPLLDSNNQQIGSTLKQVYTISNPTAALIDFDLVRYVDFADTPALGTIHGGGRRVSATGREILFQTPFGGTAGTTYSNFEAISDSGGTIQPANRFQITVFPNLNNLITAGNPLNNTVTGDSNSDGFVDPGAEYNVTLGLRTTSSLPAGGTTTYTALTYWSSGSPLSLNTPPAVTLPSGTATYVENAPGVAIDANAIVADAESPNFGGGTLNVSLISGATSDDRLEVRSDGTGAGQIGVSANAILYGGTVIGTFTGGAGGTPLVVSFNDQATPAAVQALLRNVTFRVLGDAPSTTLRGVTVVVSDGDGGTSDPVSTTINVIAVNDSPVITFSTQTLGYSGTEPPKLLDPNALVADPDSPNFDTGSLSVSITGGGTANDRLGIAPQVTSTGEITISGNQVSIDGVRFGTFSGGAGTTPLVVSLNNRATPATVQALVRSITYQSVVDSLSAVRIVTFQLADGDGATSAPAVIGVTPPAARLLRAYNPRADYHFFTTSFVEFANAVQNGGYRDETSGMGGFDVISTAGPGRVALHRLYSPGGITSENTQRGLQHHYYTANDGERDFLVSLGWIFERDEGYIYNTRVAGTSEVFRLYNRNSGVHLYTENASVKDSILAQFPGTWVQHNSVGFAFPLTANGTFQFLASGGQSLAPATAAAQSLPVTMAASAAATGDAAVLDAARLLGSAGDAKPQATGDAPSASPSSTAGTEIDEPATDAGSSGEFWTDLSRGLTENRDPLDWN